VKLKEKGQATEDSRASLELLYNVSREIVAPLDLRTVLQRVIILSMKYVGAISGSIIVIDDRGQPVDSALITEAGFHDHTTQQLRETFEHGLAGWVIRNRQAVVVPNTNEDDRWLNRSKETGDQPTAKSALSAPILAREQLVGVITLVHPKPGFFGWKHLELVQAIGDQAGIAILNARLYTESQRQARVMSALAESSTAITSSIKLDEVLQRILEQISQALRVEVVSLALIDPHTQDLVFRASTGMKSQDVIGMRLSMGQGISGWVAKEGLGAVVPVASEDERYYPEIDKALGFTTHAIACAPIRSQGETIGVLEALNPLEGVFDRDALPVLTRIGNLAGTAIRHAELFERLEAAHQRYRELFEDSIDPILMTDSEGKIQEANRQVELITGVNRDMLLGTSIDRLLAVEDTVIGQYYEKLSSGETFSYETNLVTRSGREIPIQVYTRMVNIEGVSHLQWILRDITERKNLDNLRNDLISMIYHDLRSPLANIVSSLDVLEAMLPVDGDPSQKSLVNIAIRSTERIQRLTNSLLDLRRLEAGQRITNQQPISPYSLVNDAVENVLPSVQNKNQEIILRVPKGIPLVWVDADMIRRVLTNLLENAVKYSPAGSRIYIGARVEDNQVLMWVQDTGPGIPVSERERIFDKYTRLHGKSGTRGLGLGLAFCRMAVQAHAGHIWVEDGPEAGACFKFTLPIADPSQKKAET
jgi:two-component system, NtrC family, sensor histidine kinase KinB